MGTEPCQRRNPCGASGIPGALTSAAIVLSSSAVSRRCPKCRAEIPEANYAASFAPFCSDRCRLLDLGKWLSGSYSIPGPPVDPEAELESGKPDPDETH